MTRVTTKRSGRTAAAALPALAAGTVAARAQCAMCGAAAGAGDVARGLSVSVLFLLAMLGLAVFGLVLVIVRAAQRDARRAPTDS